MMEPQLNEIIPDAEFKTADDMARIFGVSRRHFLERMSKMPGFPQPYRVGRWMRWDVAEIRKYISKNRYVGGL